ncbi:GGDEF domain-containing protein [bacterium]|nr:GGDEF domain-containing protein [bacterium]
MKQNSESTWDDRTIQQLVSYEALFKLIAEIQPLEDIKEISRQVAKQWKYFANVACFHLVVKKGEIFLVIDGFRGEADVTEVTSLTPWDAYHFESQLPCLIHMEDLQDNPAPPVHLMNKGIAEIEILPFLRLGICIGVINIAARHRPFDELDHKFNRIFSSHFTYRIYDILLRQQSINVLRDKATHDALTGLLNRGAIMERIDTVFKVSKRTKDSLSVILVDIDHFKKINDSYGHLVGDEVLRDVSRRLQAQTRDSDQLGRYGGEEFLFMLYPCSSDKVDIASERFRQAIADHPIILENGDPSGINVTISLGTATVRNSDPNIEALLKRADEALYYSKSSGRNRVTIG